MVTAVDASAEFIAALLVNGDVAARGSQRRRPTVSRSREGSRGDASWGDIAWSPDGRQAAIQAIGGVDSGATPILLLDPAAGEITELPGSLTYPGWVPYLVWSPDSRMIASTDQERQGWALDAGSGEVVYKPQPDAQGGSLRIYAWMPDSRTIIVGAGSGGLRLEDIPTGKVLRRLTGAEVGFIPTPPVVVSPDGALALIGGYSLGEYELHPYQVWDLERGRQLEAPPVGELRHINSAGCMQLNRPAVAFDGEQAISLDTDGRLMRWKVGEEEGDVLGELLVRYPCLQTPMVWSDDSARVVLETDPGRAVTVWDVSSGELIVERKDGTYPADLNGNLLAYRGGDNNLVLWNMQGNDEVGRLPGPVTPFTSGVAFSPDGSQIAYGVGNRLHVADVASSETPAVLDAYPEGQAISHIQWALVGAHRAAAHPGIEDPPGVPILCGWRFHIEAMRPDRAGQC
jgi:WD40 repeat protein